MAYSEQWGKPVTEPQEISRRSFLARGAAAGGAVVLAGAAGAALDACSSSTPSSSSTTAASGSKPGVGTGTPVRGGSLTVGLVAEIDGFYPANNHWDTNGYIYANTIYDPLCAVAADGTVQPYLCESVTPNATADVWTMTLRPNIKFNDGSALTADGGAGQLPGAQGVAAHRPGAGPGHLGDRPRPDDGRLHPAGPESGLRRRD